MSLLKNLLLKTPYTSFPSDAFRRSHDLLSIGSEPPVRSPSNPIWSTADYGWSAKTPDDTRILRSPTNGEPIQYDGKYWMVYNASDEGLGIAYSTDLVDWTDAAGNPIITGGDAEAEAWEKKVPHPTEFLYMGNEAGHSYDFWIFYRAMDIGTTHTAIGVVKSNDMSTWVRDASHNPIVDWNPAWLAGSIGVEDFMVQKMSDGDWMSLYEADRVGYVLDSGAVGAASTTDTLPHTGWADEGQVVSNAFGNRFIANPTVIRRDVAGTTYYISFYECSDAASAADIFGMYAAEADIFTLDAWTQMRNKVMNANHGDWEDGSTAPNGLILYDNAFYIYYVGDTGVNKQTGLAIGSVTDFQVRVDVHYGAGADSGKDVYLDSKCRNDFGDVRFRQGVTELSYWIQRKVDSDYAIFWVKVPKIPGTIYIYYGRSDKTTTENGADTWIEYEDWEGYAVDAVLPLGQFEATDIEEVCKITDIRAYKGSKSLLSDDDSIVNRNRVTWNFPDKASGAYKLLIAFYMDTGYATDTPFSIVHVGAGGAWCTNVSVDIPLNIEDYYAGAWHDMGVDFSEDAWHVLTFGVLIDSNEWDFDFDDTAVLGRTMNAVLTTLNGILMDLAGKPPKFLGNLGVCCLGKYMFPDTVHSIWGIEEGVAWPF